jgi:hypothetical protein
MNLNARIEISGPLLAGKGPAVVQKHIDRFVTEAAVFLEREVKVRTPQGVAGAAGLLGSIKHDVSGRGTPLVRGTVATASPYGAIVERGRRPGKMPPGGRGNALIDRPLLPWIQLKFGVTGKEADRIEYLVRRKIGRVGFKGKAMFFKALWENVPRLEKMAERQGLALTVELSDGK